MNEGKRPFDMVEGPDRAGAVDLTPSTDGTYSVKGESKTQTSEKGQVKKDRMAEQAAAMGRAVQPKEASPTSADAASEKPIDIKTLRPIEPGAATRSRRLEDITKEIEAEFEAKHGPMYRPLTTMEIARDKAAAAADGREWNGETRTLSEQAHDFWFDRSGGGKGSVPKRAEEILLKRFPEYSQKAAQPVADNDVGVDINKVAEEAKSSNAEVDSNIVAEVKEALGDKITPEAKVATDGGRMPLYEQMLKEQKAATNGKKEEGVSVGEGDKKPIENATVAEDVKIPPPGEFRIPPYEQMLKEQKDAIGKNEGDILSEKWTEQSSKMTPEKAWSEWFDAKKHSESLERDFNAKYKAHVEQLEKGPSGWIRRTFGIKLSMTPELEQMHAAVIAANDESKNKSSQLREFKETKATGYTEDRQAAVLARHQRMLVYKNGIGLHMQRIKVQEQVLAERWERSAVLKPCLDAIARHKKVSIGALALGAAVIGGTAVATGGTSILAAGVLAGFSARYGLNWLGNKTYVKSAENQLQQAGSKLGENFFEKSLSETDAEIEKWAHEIGLRKARVKTGSRIAGAVAGMTAAGIASGRLDIGLGDFGGNNTPPTELNPAPPEQGNVTPPGEGEYSNPPGGANPEPPAGGGENPPPQEGGIEGENESEVEWDEEEEEVPATPTPEGIKHPVVRGDNSWNIMEGKGPDANPVGGKSQVLKDMNFSLQERQYWLDRLFDSVKGDEAFARSVGAVKSGNLELIYPGETIDVSKLDEKLLELMHQDGEGNIPIPEARPDMPNPVASNEAAPVQVSSTDTFPEHGPVTVRNSEGLEFVIQNRVSDVNDLTIQDFGQLAVGVDSNDPNALRLLEEMGQDPESFRDIRETINRIYEANPGPVDANTTLKDFMNPEGDLPAEAPAPQGEENVPDVTPRAYDPFNDGSTEVRDASFTQAANDNMNVAAGPSPEQMQQKFNAYISGIEKPQVGFIERLFTTPPADVSGTFDQIANLSVKDVLAADAANSMPAGVSEEGWNRWVGEVKDAVKTVPDNDNLPVGELLSRVVNSKVA